MIDDMKLGLFYPLPMRFTLQAVKGEGMLAEEKVLRYRLISERNARGKEESNRNTLARTGRCLQKKIRLPKEEEEKKVRRILAASANPIHRGCGEGREKRGRYSAKVGHGRPPYVLGGNA